MVYQWLVLPQGLKSAPRDFSYIVRSVLRLVRSLGIRCAFYIDDIIVFARSRELAIQYRKFIFGVFYKIGFRISMKKSLPNPGQRIKHLGYEFDFKNCVIWVTEKKVIRIKELAIELLADLGNINGYKLAKFLGVLLSNNVAITMAGIISTGLSRCMQQLPMREATMLTQKNRLTGGKGH